MPESPDLAVVGGSGSQTQQQPINTNQPRGRPQLLLNTDELYERTGKKYCDESPDLWRVSFLGPFWVLGLATAIRGPPPPRVAHSTPLGLLYLGTHAFFCRAAGSVVAPGFVVSPRPSGAFPKGVCTRLGGFPAPRRKTDGRGCSL